MAEVAKGIIDIEINTGSAASQLQALQAQINAFNLALNKSNKAQGTFAAEYSKELQSAINKTGMFTAETVRLSTAAATLDKTLSKGKTTLGQFFSAKFNKDSAIAAETMALAAERAKRLQTQFIATSGAANGFQEAIAVRPLAAFSSEAAVAAQRTQILSNMFKQGTTQLINFGKNVQWAGRQLMVGFTVPLTIFGSVAGKTFMELEKQAVAFKKVYGDIFTTPAELDKNLEAVKGLASEYTKYGIAVKDTIGLAAQAAAAGRQNADLTDAVSQATRLATLGQMDQNAALETTISLQSAFKLSGQDLADTINFLNMVENQTVVSLQDIAAAIPRVAPVIQGLGGDVKDLTVFLAAMQEGGVDAAEGANALKSGLASLINPTKQATEMLNGMGINLETIIQANRGDLMGTVQAFAQALAGLDQFSRQQALEQVFGKFQYAKLGALFDNISRKGSQAQQVIATMGYSTEQLGATADKELKTIEESFGVQLTGAVERFKLAIAPIGQLFVQLAIPVVNFITKIVDGFNSLSDGQKRFAAIATVIVGVVVPAVTMLAGLFLNLVGTLAKMTQGIALFAKGFVTGGPIGAFRALTQSSKYLSLAEIDAAMAAQQLSGANEILNKTLFQQAIQGNAAAAAINNLTRAYGAMAATQGAAGALPSFGTAAAAGTAARGGKAGAFTVRTLRRNSGGGVPGVGNTDTVPAMLTPGEFVINKEATKQNLGLLKAINDGGIQKFSQGGSVLDELAAVRAIGFGATGSVSSIRRASSKQQTGMTFAHMQRNLIDAKTPQGRQYFDDLYRLLSENGMLKGNQLATYAHGSKNGWQGWRVTGNLGFDLSKQTMLPNGEFVSINSRLNRGGIPANILLQDLNKNFSAGKNPYARMLRNVGIKDRSMIDSISSLIHSRVTQDLASRGSKVISDSDLYKDMTKITVQSMREGLVNDPNKTNVLKNLFAASEVRTGRVPRLSDPTKLSDTKYGISGTLSKLAGRGATLGRIGRLVLRRNSGGPVPGTGNTDIVPAMLTPGEFVVNKKAASQNQQLLEMMNGGKVQGYNKGGLIQGEDGRFRRPNGQFASAAEIAKFQKGTISSRVGKVASSRVGGFAGTMVGGMAGYSAGKALTGGSEMGGIAGSIIGPMLPKAAAAAAAAIGVSTAAFVGVAAPLALAGFAIYKLNKSLEEAASSGAALSEAMYGSAKTTNAMADAFGRETNASALRRKSVEKAGGQEITQESIAASSEFMKTDAAAEIIKDLELVKKSGEDVALALRNQLASSIIAGVITPEEAKAVAMDIGKALGDENIAINVSGQLSSLLGPNGEKIVNNIVEITAEISPKINSQKIQKDAEEAYDSLNIAQKFGEFFTGGKESFVEQFAIDKISEENASALTKEAEARALLNIAYQEGTISLKEYLDAENKLNSGAKDRSSFVENANAQALGFANTFAMESKLQEYLANLNVDTTGMTTLEASQAQALGQARAREDSQGKAAYSAIVTESKEALKQSFINDDMDATMAETIVSEIENGIALIDPQIFDKLISGQISLDRLPLLEKMIKDGIPTKEIDSLFSNLKILESIPNIDLIIDIKNPDPTEVQDLVNEYLRFESLSDSEKSLEVKSNVTADYLKEFKLSYEAILALPDNEIVNVIKTVDVLVELRARTEVKGGPGSKNAFQKAGEDARKFLSQFSSIGDGASATPSVDSGTGSGSGKQTLKEYLAEFKKLTQERQKYLQETMKYLGTAKMEAIALIDQQRYLEAIAMTESKSNKVRKQGKKILEELITLAEQQMDIQRATAFLALSAEEKAILSLEMKGKLLDKNAEKENKALRDKQRQVELNDREIQKISEQEEVVNKAYDSRLEALDKVSQANDRIAEQDRSRISLASALASGDIAAAANAASEMQQQEAEYRIEDTRAALEAQRQRDLAPLISARTALEEKNKGTQIEIQGIQDALYEIESKRTALAEQRAAAEEKTYLMQQKQTIAALQKQSNLTPEQQNALAVLQQDVANIENAKNYGGSIRKMAFGGIAYKGSNEPPPALRMQYGSTVPGIGMTDKVPALLTPGEFVVRKSVAKQYGGFLNALNGQVFPGIGERNAVPTNNFLDGIGSPRYSIPTSPVSDMPVASTSVVSTSAPMYNSTYNVNVNVSGTNASPDDIANVVMAKLSQQNRGNLRSSRY